MLRVSFVDLGILATIINVKIQRNKA